jgi:hypothetical protein
MAVFATLGSGFAHDKSKESQTGFPTILLAENGRNMCKTARFALISA